MRSDVPAEFAPDAILRVLTAHRVEFVVIGGLAAYLQGSPIPTVDVDVVPKRQRENFARLSAALHELDARIRAEGAPEAGVPFGHDADTLAGMPVLNVCTKHGDLDITVEPAGTAGYADLRRDAVEVVLHGTPVLLASLADIVRSKAAANRDKDRRALPVLRELLSRQARGPG